MKCCLAYPEGLMLERFIVARLIMESLSSKREPAVKRAPLKLSVSSDDIEDRLFSECRKHEC